MFETLVKKLNLNNCTIKKLCGYNNLNYKIIKNNKAQILKTYRYEEQLHALVQAENKTLLFLHQQLPNKFPKPKTFSDDTLIKTISPDGQPLICRMLSFLEGEFLGDVKHTSKLFKSFGCFLAQLNLKLQKFTNYTIQARQSDWDLQYTLLNKRYLDDIKNAQDRNLVDYFLQQFAENVTPKLATMRKSIIHNDANEWNVLTSNGKVTTLIDFGDLAYTQLINELATAITYACYDKKDPIKWAVVILKSYHEILPIKELEVEVLYYLIAAKLCMSVCHSAHSKKISPDNDYALVSEKLAWKMLYGWLKINPLAAENNFRKAINLPARKEIPIEKIVQQRHDYTSPILSLSYQQPIYMQKAAFQYMYDAYGNTFLDAYNNIPHVGHSHPKIVAAGQKQMAKLNTNTRYLYDIFQQYSKKILAKFPKPLNKIYYVNSGSAACDLAIRIALSHSKNADLMVMEHGYHGHTRTTTDISDYKFSNKKGQGQKEHILKAPIPDTYRGQYTNNDGSAGKSYAQDAIQQILDSNRAIAAFISEPIVGCAGQVPLAKGYLRELYPAIRKQGGLCISDEVQTGFGRLGEYFWGFEAQEVIPDIVVIGKPMANGHPMAAVITTDEIAQSFAKGVEFFSSFGGNPVSCAIALSVLEVIEEEELQHNAKHVGEYYRSLFVELAKKYSCIGDVRGSGLFIGIEIVKENNQVPNTPLAHTIKNELRKNNILISTDGPHDNVLKTKPALSFSKVQAELVVSCIEDVLKKNIKRE